MARVMGEPIEKRVPMNVILLIVLGMVGVAYCDRSTFVKMQQESERIDKMINEQIKREQMIESRQNVENHGDYDRLLLRNLDIHSGDDVMDELRYLQETLQARNSQASDQAEIESKATTKHGFQMITETDPIKLLESLQLKDVVGSKNICRKGTSIPNSNNDGSTLNINNKEKLSPEDALKEIQQAMQHSKANAMVSNRDRIIDELNETHTICFFGSTISHKSSAISTFETSCKNPRTIGQLSLSNLKFTSQLASLHILDFHKQLDDIPSPHTIVCGVATILISHSSASMSLTQYLPFTCFDQIPLLENTNSKKQVPSEQSVQDPNQRHDL